MGRGAREGWYTRESSVVVGSGVYVVGNNFHDVVRGYVNLMPLWTIVVAVSMEKEGAI